MVKDKFVLKCMGLLFFPFIDLLLFLFLFFYFGFIDPRKVARICNVSVMYLV